MSVSRLLLVLILVITALNLAFIVFALGNIKTIQSNNSTLEKKLEETIKKQDEGNLLLGEIKKNLEASKSAVLGAAETPATPSPKSQATFITINDKKWEDVSVYEDKSYSAKVISKAKYGEIYLYYKKEDSWYFIASEDGKAGWVNARFFKELDALP